MERRRARFGEFEFDFRTLELYRDGERLPVTGKALTLLAALLERPGELVTRAELRERLWAAGLHVDFDENLNAAVRKLRSALGDSAEAPRLVETLPRRGYRFIGRLETGERAVEHTAPSAASRGRRRFWAAWAAAAVLLALAWRGFGELAQSRRPTVAVLEFVNLSGDPKQDHVSVGLRSELSAQLGAQAETSLDLVDRGPRGADFVVTGSSRRDDTGLYVTAALVRRDGVQVWSESFACPRQDLFAMQRQLATKIATKLLADLRSG